MYNYFENCKFKWQFPILHEWVNTSDFIFFLGIAIRITMSIMYMSCVCNEYIIILLLGHFLFISFDSSPSGMR